jgi:hypothetical protein
MKVRILELRLSALFLLSITLIAFELEVMRAFAVASWSNFGAMVISIALLGYGLAGTLLTFLNRRILRSPDTWLTVSAALLGPSMAMAHVLSQRVPFNPVLIASQPGQLWWIAAYYALYSVPFFVGALFIGVSFVSLSSKIHQLYFWNMVGSGLGGFLILGLMYLLPPGHLILPLLGLAALISLLCFVRWSPERQGMRLEPGGVLITVLAFAASFLAVLFYGELRVSEFKAISYARRFPDAQEVYHTYGPTGEMDVYSSSYFHFAPGLSDNASLNVREMPRQAFLGLYIDSGGPIGVMRKLRPAEEAYIDYLPMSAPYLIMKDARVLLLKLGGGAGAFTALHNGAERVDIVESNPALVHMLRDVPFFVAYTGGLLSDPRVEVINTEPRAYARATRQRYDLVEISLIDSIGLSQTGGYPVEENYIYTVEGLQDYMRCLKPQGILSITVWNRLTPPRNVPKLLATVTEALRREGAQDPERRIFAFDLLLSTATVLVKSSPFSPEEIQRLRDFCHRMSFQVSHYPGMPGRSKDFDAMLAAYTNQYHPAGSGSPGGREGSASSDLLPNDLYYFSLQWMLAGRSAELFRQYVFDVRPATDDRPYYTAYLKPRTIGLFRGHMGEISEEWGYLLLLGTFAQSILFGLLIIMLPVIGRWRELFSGSRGVLGVILYYSCLGVGYMMVEIFLIQRLVFYLSNPVFSNSIVITSMLVVSGLGSLLSQRLPLSRGRRTLFAALGIAGSLLFYLFGLPPVLSRTLGLGLPVKILLSMLFIFPAAFSLGVPFPTGLAALSENRRGLLPWAWGMNGALSVTGAVLARLVSISTGFAAVLSITIALYLLAALVFRANELPERPGAA